MLPWVVAYAAFLLALRWRHLRFPPALLWLGLVSYSVYLLHPVVLPVVDDGAFDPWVGLGLLLVVTLAASALAQRFVEAPGQDLGRRWRARIRARSARVEGDAATVPGP